MTKKSIEILKHLRKHGETKYGELSSIINCSGSATENPYIKELREAKYIKLNDPGYAQNGVPEVERVKLTITVDGEAYLDAFKNEKFRFWLPIIVSNVMALAALIISIIALLL